MDTVTLDITIDRPREEVFAYLSDVANHPEFSDHYLTDWHLTRVDSVGRGGKYNRTKTFHQWTLEPDAAGTRLEYVYETEPPLPTDRLVEKLSGRHRWVKRNAGKALRRMRSILEENRDRGARATVAGLD